MPLLIVCPKCKQQLKIADTAAGKPIKCPACAAVFQAGKPVPTPAVAAAPAKPRTVAPPPMVKPAAGPAVAEKSPAETPAASPSPKAVTKKKSKALLYGCLSGVFVVLLLIGLGIAGIFWLVNKGKNALQDWASTVTTRKTSAIASKPPEKDKQSVEGEGRKPDSQPKANVQPEARKTPAKAPSDLDAEIAVAGAGLKLVKLDLNSAGLPLTMDAPEGATAKESYGYVLVMGGQHFTIRIDIGRDDPAGIKKAAFGEEMVFASRDLVLRKGGLLGSSAYQFGLNVTAGYRDYFLKNLPIVEHKPVTHRKADCLLMIKCARTLAPKTPLPADPVAALKELKIDVEPDRDDKIRLVNMGRNATDRTLVLVKRFPDLRTLILEGAPIHDDSLAQLSDRTQLQKLNLGSTRITDAGLKHLSRLDNLESLDLSGMFVPLNITNAGLTHLADLHKLQKLDLFGTKVDDDGLAQLKNLSALKSLDLSKTPVTGAGLLHLKDIPTLTSLRLYRAKVTDAGLAGLRGVPNLKKLSLSDTRIGDSGLTHLRELKNLEELSLDRTRISDAGLAHLKGLKELQKLSLDGVKNVTDDGTAHLKELNKLEKVILRGTKVTDKGAQELRNALPEANIESGAK